MAGGDHRLSSLEVPGRLTENDKADLAASFQAVAIETVVDKTIMAYKEFKPAAVVIAGGVACNLELRRILKECLPLEMVYAPASLCTDNGAMIACLACHQVMQSKPPVDPFKLSINPSLSM